jgi:copper chaperone CopZ
MRLFRLSGLTALSLLCLTSLTVAGEVKVKAVHLCCGGCVSAVTDALEKVPGVSGGSANQDDGTVTFQATDAKAATAGLKAIAGAGFFGTATHGGKNLAVPVTKIDPKLTADSVTLTGVHLCCGTCVTASSTALKKVKGVTGVEGDQDNGSLIVKGKQVKVAELLDALHGAGFHGNVKK